MQNSYVNSTKSAFSPLNVSSSRAGFFNGVTSTPLSSPTNPLFLRNKLTTLKSPPTYSLSNVTTFQSNTPLQNNGPLLATTKFNVSLGTYMETSSPGLTSRIVQYNNEQKNLTHQAKYGSPGLFPIVHFFKKEVPTISPKPKRVTVKIASPDTSWYNNPEYDTKLGHRNPNLQNPNLNQSSAESETRSVLDALKEISRKRIHSTNDFEVEHDASKRQKRLEQAPTTPEIGNKRVREEDSPITEPTKSPVQPSAKKICIVDMLAASYTSSQLYNDKLEKGKKKKIEISVNDVEKPQRQQKKSLTVGTQTPQTEMAATSKEKATQSATSQQEPESEQPTKSILFDEKRLQIGRKNRLAALLSAITGENAQYLSHEKSDNEEENRSSTPPSTSTTKLVSILSPQNKPKHDKHVTFNLPPQQKEIDVAVTTTAESTKSVSTPEKPVNFSNTETPKVTLTTPAATKLIFEEKKEENTESSAKKNDEKVESASIQFTSGGALPTASISAGTTQTPSSPKSGGFKFDLIKSPEAAKTVPLPALPAPTFNFGGSEAKMGSALSTVTTTTSALASPAFNFGDKTSTNSANNMKDISKGTPVTTSGPTFNLTGSSANPVSPFAFGADTSKSTPLNTQTTSSSTFEGFKSVSNANFEVKNHPTTVQSGFSAVPNRLSFGVPATSAAPIFGVATTNATTNFGVSGAPSFGLTKSSSAAPSFGVTTPSSAPAFGATTSSNTPAFAVSTTSSNPPAFGILTSAPNTPSFGAATTSSSASTFALNNPSNSKSSPFGGFATSGSTPSFTVSTASTFGTQNTAATHSTFSSSGFGPPNVLAPSAGKQFGPNTTHSSMFVANPASQSFNANLPSTNSGVFGAPSEPSGKLFAFGSNQNNNAMVTTTTKANFNFVATTTPSVNFDTKPMQSQTLFGTTASATNIFGTPTATTTGSVGNNLFKSPGSTNFNQFGAKPETNAFGAKAESTFGTSFNNFGAPSTNSGVFGTNTASTFGNGGFGANQANSTFGAASNNNNNSFVIPPVQANFGATQNNFGSTPSAANIFNSNNNANAFGNTGTNPPFGFSSGDGAFGKPQPPTASATFGSAPTSDNSAFQFGGATSATNPAFGNATNPTQAPPTGQSGIFAFGSPNANPPPSAPTGGVFTFGSADAKPAYNFSAGSNATPSFGGGGANFGAGFNSPQFSGGPVPGVFSIGSGSSAGPKSRNQFKTKRRV